MTTTLRLANLALALFSPCVVVQAQDLLDQQPSQKFSLLGSAGIESNADNFVVSGPVGTTLGKVTLWGTWTPSGLQNTDTFDVLVHGNATGPFGDIPSGLIASFPGLAPTVTATGKTMPTASGGLPEYELVIDLPAGVALVPGNYWVEAFSTDSAASGDTFAWEMAPQDMLNGGPCIAWSTTTPGTVWNACTPFPETDMAMLLTSISATVYCTAKNNSLGCVPAISGTGSPSATATSGFAVDVAMVRNNKSGLFFYTVNGA